MHLIFQLTTKDEEEDFSASEARDFFFLLASNWGSKEKKLKLPQAETLRNLIFCGGLGNHQTRLDTH